MDLVRNGAGGGTVGCQLSQNLQAGYKLYMLSLKHSYLKNGLNYFFFHQQYGLNLKIQFLLKNPVSAVQAKRLYVVNFAGAISILRSILIRLAAIGCKLTVCILWFKKK